MFTIVLKLPSERMSSLAHSAFERISLKFGLKQKVRKMSHQIFLQIIQIFDEYLLQICREFVLIAVGQAIANPLKCMKLKLFSEILDRTMRTVVQ